MASNMNNIFSCVTLSKQRLTLRYSCKQRDNWRCALCGDIAPLGRRRVASGESYSVAIKPLTTRRVTRLFTLSRGIMRITSLLANSMTRVRCADDVRQRNL